MSPQRKSRGVNPAHGTAHIRCHVLRARRHAPSVRQETGHCFYPRGIVRGLRQKLSEYDWLHSARAARSATARGQLGISATLRT